MTGWKKASTRPAAPPWTRTENGIVQIEGVPFAVGGLLPGEEGTVAVSGRNKQRAQLVRVDKAVPERVRPRCPVFGRCGGCRLQHLSYDGQLELKQRTVEQLMQEYIAQGAKFLPDSGDERALALPQQSARHLLAGRAGTDCQRHL